MKLQCTILLLALPAFMGGMACKTDPVEEEGFVDENSAVRLPGETYEEAENRYRGKLSAVNLSAYMNLHSVKSLSVPYAEADWSGVTEWDDDETVTAAFERGRDERFLLADDRPDFPRRSTWLYPDNGCYARGDLMVRNMVGWGYPATTKIFAFGELAAASSNISGGTVHWWYHTAPLAAVDGTVYVLDPAVDPSAPQTIETWVGRITSNTATLTVAVCETFAYGPYSVCVSAQNLGPARATGDQKLLLDDEWQRLLDLGRDPNVELGDSPPWLASTR